MCIGDACVQIKEQCADPKRRHQLQRAYLAKRHLKPPWCTHDYVYFKTNSGGFVGVCSLCGKKNVVK